MARNIVKHRNIYLFITILSLIGFITGFSFYKIQPKEVKENIKETININEDLSSPTNNIIKRTKESITILVSSIFIIPELCNIFKIFTKPFEIGFIFCFLTTYNLKFAFIYSLTYLIIPLIFIFILIRISINITTLIIKLILLREKKTLLMVKKLVFKYIIITSFMLFYELIICIFSSNINAYLMTFLNV